MLILGQYENYGFEIDSLTKRWLKFHKIFFPAKSAKKLKKNPWFYENDEIWGFYGFKVVYMGGHYQPINKKFFFTTLQHHISSKKILVDLPTLLKKIFKKNNYVL